MGWGTVGNVTTTHLNSATDDPSQARVELYNALVELQAVINGRNSASGVAGLDASSKISATQLPNTLVSASGQDLTLDPDTSRVRIENIINLEPRTVAQLEALVSEVGDVAYCSNGNAGAACIAVAAGTQDSQGDYVWYRIALGSQISAT